MVCLWSRAWGTACESEAHAWQSDLPGTLTEEQLLELQASVRTLSCPALVSSLACVSCFGHVIQVVADSRLHGKKKPIASCLHSLGPACQCSKVWARCGELGTNACELSL